MNSDANANTHEADLIKRARELSDHRLDATHSAARAAHLLKMAESLTIVRAMENGLRDENAKLCERLSESTKVLEMLTDPTSITNSTVIVAWSQCLVVAAKNRALIDSNKSQTPPKLPD